MGTFGFNVTIHFGSAAASNYPSSSSLESSSSSICCNGGGSSSSTLGRLVSLVGVVPGESVSFYVCCPKSLPLKMVANVLSLSRPDSLSGGGTLPCKASLSCCAACMTASSGVTVGAVMYLCLKNIVSLP